MSFYEVKKRCTLQGTACSFEEYLAHFFPAKLSDAEKELIKTMALSAGDGHLAHPCSDEALLFSLREKKILGAQGSLLIEENSLVYFPKMYELESALIAKLLPRLARKSLPSYHDLEGLNSMQQKAVQFALEYSFLIVTGGPGTGKTYTASRIASAITSSIANPRILLMAPTGKAAAKLAGQIKCPHAHIEAGTLHHLLGIYPGKAKQVGKKLEAHLVIVDESSMIDASLFIDFLDALQDHTRVVMLGDQDQLPAIGTGAFFTDLVDCPFVAKVKLHECIRIQNQEIKDLADSILTGSVNEALLDKYLSPWESIPDLFERTKDKFPKTLDFASLEKFCILSFLRQGPYGSDALNAYFAERLQQNKENVYLPIIATKNARDFAISNGDMGFLQIEKGKKILHFPEKVLSPLFFPHYSYAFAISVHKSQGSEFEEVYLIGSNEAKTFGRKALYTGITRAKKHLKLFGSKEIFIESSLFSEKRISGISARLGSLSSTASINVSNLGSFS